MLFSSTRLVLDPESLQPYGKRLGLLCAGWGLLLLGSMACPLCLQVWQELDWSLYNLFQSLLVQSEATAWLMAILNAHPVGNLLMDVAFGLVGFPWLLASGSRRGLIERLSLISYYLVVWKVTMSVVNRWFFGEILQFHRDSPTLLESPLVNLQEWAPNMNVKVFAHNTFPSDHAMQLLLLALVLAGRPRPWTGLAVPVSLFFCFPRLFSGAHWWSDVAVGGMGVALVAFAFWFCTPLYSGGMELCGRLWNWLLPAPASPKGQKGHESQA